MQEIQFHPNHYVGDITSQVQIRLEGQHWSTGPCLQLTQYSTTGFSPYFLMYGRELQLPINVTLELTPKLVAMPTSTKYVQKLREHIGWDHKKADLFQQKEA